MPKAGGSTLDKGGDEDGGIEGKAIGIDLGLTYYPQKNIQFTASAVDIGFINHTKEVEGLRYKGYYKFEGVKPNFFAAAITRSRRSGLTPSPLEKTSETSDLDTPAAAATSRIVGRLV